MYWVDTTIVPLLDARGKPCQYLAIRSDITRRKSAEARLLEQASLAKLGELAAMVAHEVRNPLAALKGALQVLGPRLPDDRPEHHIVKAMLNRIDALNERVNDILLYAGTTPPQIECVALEALLVDAAISARAATGSRHRIEIDASDLTVSADRHMLHEAIVNLLVNACQATNGPKPILATTQAAGGWCRIAVADRGPGIPPAIRERVFEPFYTTKPSGTGLGLAIVKRLMERQGGSGDARRPGRRRHRGDHRRAIARRLRNCQSLIASLRGCQTFRPADISSPLRKSRHLITGRHWTGYSSARFWIGQR